MKLVRQVAEGTGGLILGIILLLLGLSVATGVVIILVRWVISFFGHATT